MNPQEFPEEDKIQENISELVQGLKEQYIAEIHALEKENLFLIYLNSSFLLIIIVLVWMISKKVK